jgi:hypothetical protein
MPGFGKRVQCELAGVALAPAAEATAPPSCTWSDIEASTGSARVAGAVVLPEVKDYPER